MFKSIPVVVLSLISCRHRRDAATLSDFQCVYPSSEALKKKGIECALERSLRAAHYKEAGRILLILNIHT